MDLLHLASSSSDISCKQIIEQSREVMNLEKIQHLVENDMKS